MFRKLLEFLGLSKRPDVNLPCKPCAEDCRDFEDCVDSAPAIAPELVEPAIVAEFYKQDVPPPPLTPVETAAPVAETKSTKVKKAPAEKKPVAKKKSAQAGKAGMTTPAKKKVTKKK